MWERYGDLQRVERDFRTMKTGLLELRPIFLRKAGRTRAHALVAMLALKLVRALERKIASLKISAAEALDRLDAVRLVSLGAPGHGDLRLAREEDPSEAAYAPDARKRACIPGDLLSRLVRDDMLQPQSCGLPGRRLRRMPHAR